MKLDNQTSWSTRDLRAILARVVREEEFPTARVPHLRVEIVTRRTRWVTNYAGGWAYFNLNMVRLKLPLPGRVNDRSDLAADIAHVMAHELQHCLGKRHPEMRGSRYMSRVHPFNKDWRARYATMPLRTQEECRKPKVKPTAEQKAMQGIAYYETLLKTWRRKLALATTKVKRYERDLRSMNRKLDKMRAASPAPTQEV